MLSRAHCIIGPTVHSFSKKSDCTRRVIPRHDSHARRAVTREKLPADLAARRMISCQPYVNVHGIIYWQQLTFRLPSARCSPFLLSLPRSLSFSLDFHPRGIISPDSSPHHSSPLLSLFLSSPPLLARCLSSSRPALFTLARVLFSVGPTVRSVFVSLLLPSSSPLTHALTFSSRLSSPLSPISQSYPRQRKMPGVSQSRERPAFSA